jgi:hypothetical protein
MLNVPRQGLKAGLPVWKAVARNPIKVPHYLYFLGSQYVTTDGGAVSAWADAGLSSGLPAPVRALAQGTANLQPAHDTSDEHLRFDTTTGEKDKLAFNVAVEMAGVLVCATSNGIFAYEVDDDSVAEITALGNQTGYYQALDLYAYILFPTSITAVELAGVIRYLDENTNATKNPVGSLEYYWRGRTDLVTPKFAALDFSGVTSFRYSWYPCTSLTTFPAINMSAGTTFQSAWESCTALTSMPAIALTAGTDFNNAWKSCTAMTSFLATGLNSGTNFTGAWRNCTALATMPAIPLTAGTNFYLAWYGNTSLTSFLATGLDSGTNFTQTWANCSALATFPAIPLTAGTNFNSSWLGMTSLTSFLATGLNSGTDFSYTWYGCTALATFPAIPLTAGTNFANAWWGMTSLTSFLATGLDSGTNFSNAWRGCTALATFPAIPLTAGLIFSYAWYGCTSLTSFLATGLDSGTTFTSTWNGCTALTSFPVLDLSGGTSFGGTWNNTRIVSFPALDLSSGTYFAWGWSANTSMVSFGACNMNAGANFESAWSGLSALTTFPAGVFDDWNPASITARCFRNAWYGCTALTEQSVENILLSISASGQWATSTGTSSGTPLAGKEIDIDSNNVNVDNLTPATRAACTALQSRGWEVVINGSVVSEYALSFNGTDEYVTTGYIIPAIATQTNACWAKGTASGYQILMSDFASSGANVTSRVHLGFYNQDIYISIGDGSAFYYATGANTYDATSTFFDGNWHHIALTINAETQKFYIDGALVHTHDTTDAGTRSGGTSAVLGTAGTDSAVIGRFGAYAAGYWDGEIDEVAIWDVALDAAAVASVYNSGRPINLSENGPWPSNYDNSGDLVSWWRMGDSDSGAGNFVTDVIATDGEALHLPGIAANYASVPDAADLDGFGDFTLQVDDVTFTDWTPSAYQALLTKYNSSGNQRAWFLALAPSGLIQLDVSLDGGASPTTYQSSVATGIADGATATIRALRISSTIRFYVDGVKLGDDVAGSATVLPNVLAPVEIGASGAGASYPLLGSLTRARVWNTSTPDSSTPVLDINFALANKGATSFTATSGQVVTVHSTAIATPAAIRSATDGVLVNTPTFVVDNPPNYSDYSVDFGGTNENIDCGTGLGTALGDNYAGSLTVSLWFKADVTSGHAALFYIGKNTSVHGELNIILASNILYYRLNQSGWTKTVAFTDTASWHHLACVYATGNESNSKMYLDGVVVGSDVGSFPSPTDMDFAGDKTIIGAYYSVNGYPFDGKIDEVAVWTSALTSAQINDIYNGGVPAALADSPVGWWRMGENNAGTGVTITDQGSGTNNGTLLNTPTFSRSVPAEDATWNNRSLTFNGSDESMTTSADDTLASKSYSFWAKSTKTTCNGVFDHGGAALGAFSFNVSASRPLLYMASGFYRYWTNNSAQDDGAWHHHVVYIEHDNNANCKWYVDGVVQGAEITGSGSGDAYTSALSIGKADTDYFDGSLDEFAVFDGELTPSQILQIYNGGKPASLKEFSPDSWYRMGDDDDAGGTTIRDLGYVVNSEMVINGKFDSDAGWTGSEAGWSFAGGKAVATAAGDTYTLQRYDGGTLVVGELYHIKFTVSDYSAGSIRAKLGGALVGPTITANGDYSMNVACTDAGSGGAANKIAIQSTSASTTLKIDNFSVKQGNLVVEDPYTAARWAASSGNTETFVAGESVRFDRPASGGSSQGGYTYFTTSSYGCLAEALVANTTYEVSFTLDSDDDNIGADILGSAWAGHTYSTTGAGVKTMYLHYVSGSPYITFFNLDNSKYVKLSGLTVKAINGNPATLVNTPTFSTDTP